MPGRQGAGHFGSRDRALRNVGPRLNRDGAGAGARRGLANLPQLFDDLVESPAVDELHDVVMQPVGLTESKDGHDVAVMQPRGRPRLAARTARRAAFVEHGRPRQHLQRDVPAQHSCSAS